MQEHFHPYVEPSIRIIAPLLKSPHEDVRSFSLVSLPEFVRSTGKAVAIAHQQQQQPLSPQQFQQEQTIHNNNNQQQQLQQLHNIADYSLGLLVDAIVVEDTLDLIMTGLQSLKQVCMFVSYRLYLYMFHHYYNDFQFNIIYILQRI